MLIAEVVARAKGTREVEDKAALDFIACLLLLDVPAEDRAAALAFTQRFQQTTGPVMAKALEDTVFYRYNRLIALNEVGGEPDHFGAEPDRLHAAMAERLRRQPAGLSATSDARYQAWRGRPRAPRGAIRAAIRMGGACGALVESQRAPVDLRGWQHLPRPRDRMAVLPGTARCLADAPAAGGPVGARRCLRAAWPISC